MRMINSIIIALCLVSVIGCGKKYKLHRDLVNQSSEWAFYRGNIAADGSISSEKFGGKLDVIWEFKSNDKPVGPLTIYNGVLIYPGARNRVKCISTNNGTYQGYIKARGVAQTGLVVSDSIAYFATAPKKSKLRAVNLLNKKTLWKKDVKDAVGGSIIIEEKIILSSAEGRLLAFDKMTGEILWQFKSKHRFTTPPLFDGFAIWQVSEEGTLFAIKPSDGKLIRQVKLNTPVVASIAFHTYLYVCDMHGVVYKIDTSDGQIIWQAETDGASWGAVAVSGSSLFIGHSGGDILSLSVDDGSVQWRFDAVDIVAASVLHVGRYLAFGSKKGNFFLLNSSDGTLVEKRKLRGAITTAPVSDGQYIFVATDKGNITCFGVKNDRQEKTDE